MAEPVIKSAKTFVLIASDDDQLARAVAMSLIEDKRLLHQKFNGSRPPPWQAMTNHMTPGANRDEIRASMDDVLGHKDRFMMILSGYQNTPDWNDALADFMATNRLSATFIVAEGDTPPAPVRALFDAYTELPEQAETDPVDLARVAIMLARQSSALVAAPGTRALH
jgi:hypothetical protein